MPNMTRCTSRRSRRVRRTQRCSGRRAATAGCYLRKIKTLAASLSLEVGRAWSGTSSPSSRAVSSQMGPSRSCCRAIRRSVVWALPGRRGGPVPFAAAAQSNPRGPPIDLTPPHRRARQKPIRLPGLHRGESARGELTRKGVETDPLRTPAGRRKGRGVSSHAMVRDRQRRCPTTHRLIPARR
jgi:hypothetical protein